jgi:hypothetical protein
MGWLAAGTFWGPIEGTRCSQALYLSLDREVSFMPLRVGWHLAVWVFSSGITRESHVKPPSQDFPGGGAALAPVWSDGEVLAFVGSHPCMVTQPPLRS